MSSKRTPKPAKSLQVALFLGDPTKAAELGVEIAMAASQHEGAVVSARHELDGKTACVVEFHNEGQMLHGTVSLRDTFKLQTTGYRRLLVSEAVNP
jgi:3-dehydroquinate dehydratase